MSDGLAAFLAARLDEDEAAAEAAGGSTPQGTWAQVDPERRPGRIDCDSGYVVTRDEGSPDDGQAPHIARHDPARVLRDVAAKRDLLNKYQSAATADRYSPDEAPIDHFQDGLECALRCLAAAWSDHPDYRPDLP